jgi:hypothetical protein
MRFLLWLVVWLVVPCYVAYSATTISAASFALGGIVDILAASAAGAVIYGFTTSDVTTRQRIFLSLASFGAGVVCAADLAALLDWLTPASIHPTRALGALVGSVVSVGLLKFIARSAANPLDLINLLRGKNDGKK